MAWRYVTGSDVPVFADGLRSGSRLPTRPPTPAGAHHGSAQSSPATGGPPDPGAAHRLPPAPIEPSARLERRPDPPRIPASTLIAALLWAVFVLPVLVPAGAGAVVPGLVLLLPLNLLVVVLRGPVLARLRSICARDPTTQPAGEDSRRRRGARWHR